MTNKFDYIVVGGGSAGCAVANRLSENDTNKVLLIEAGRSSHPISRLPASFALLIDNPLANWRYRSEPEENTGNREIPIPRGKLLGGSSSINGLVFVRGNKLDYDTWAQMGNLGWSFDDILPIYKKMLQKSRRMEKSIFINHNIIYNKNEGLFCQGKILNFKSNIKSGYFRIDLTTFSCFF